jgi:hypothetical protein
MSATTLTHEDASAQLLDLVYGEAEGAAKAALEAHVAGCAQCQSELAALGDTRALLRSGLEEPPVPARAHAKILEAAKAAVAVPAAAKAAAPAKAKAPAPSFWERMRGRWTFPTLATVGAVAVVVVTSKMFLDPKRAFEQMESSRAPVEEVPAAAPVARQEAPAQTAPAPSAEAPADDKAAPAEMSEALKRRRAAIEQLRVGSLRDRQRTHSVDERLRSAMDRLDGAGYGLGAVGSGSGGGGVAAPMKRDELAKALRANAAEKAAEPAAPPPAPVAAKPAAAPARNYASPPAGWEAEGKASQPKGGVARGAVGGAVAPAPASPPAVATAPAKRKAIAKDDSERDEAPMEELSESRAREQSADGDKAEKKKESAPQPDAATLARKAEQLFAAGRWGEAITAYRELLRRFPEADGAGQWRSRLVQAQREEAVVREKAATKAAPAAQ